MFIAYNAIVFWGWLLYFEFVESLAMVLVSVAALIIYFRSQKYLVTTIQLRKGMYKISVSGQLTVQNTSQSPNDSFVLHVEINGFSLSKKVKLYVNTMKLSAYPFNGTLMIQSDKNQ